MSYLNNIWSEFRYNSHYHQVFISNEIPTRHLRWGSLYYCVYQGQTPAYAEFLVFRNITISVLLPWLWKQLDPVSTPCLWKPWQQPNQTHIFQGWFPFQSVFIIVHQWLLMEHFILIFVLFVQSDCFVACLCLPWLWNHQTLPVFISENRQASKLFVLISFLM